MIDKQKLIKVINKDFGSVGYTVPDLGVYRDFYPGEIKEVTFEELLKLSYLPGGKTILKELLEIMDEEAIEEIFTEPFEPEYHYSKEDIKKVMLEGTLDQFLDCLDFSPEVVKENIKEMAVELQLNDIEKREAIKDRLGFDVTKAIEIRNTKFDGGDDDEEESKSKTAKRRAAPMKTTKPAPTGRRYRPEQ